MVLFGGLPRETVVPVDSYRLHYEALTLRGSFHHRPRDVRAALALLERAASSIARCSRTSSRWPTWSSRCAAAPAWRRATVCSRR